jgi:4-amino-4-deoxy-L-arabinose transferase-like glycosyltransferase
MVLSSVVIMADMPALFWATLASWLLVRTWPVEVKTLPELHETQLHRGHGGLAGLVLGLAVATRWIYGLLALPFAAYALVQTRRFRTWRFLFIPVLGGLGVLLPQLWLSLNRPDSLLHNWLLNWRPMNAFARQFAHVDGDYAYTLPVALYYLQPLSHPNYMVPVLGLAALWGAWSLWRRRIWQPLILLGGWFGVVYLFLAGIPYENFRFGLTLFYRWYYWRG